MVIVSKNGNTSFRSEEIEYAGQVPTDESIKSSKTELTNKVKIGFKSGAVLIIICKDVTEASGFLKSIIEAMTKDYTYIHYDTNS